MNKSFLFDFKYCLLTSNKRKEKKTSVSLAALYMVMSGKCSNLLVFTHNIFCFFLDDDEIWFFAKPSDKFEDSFTHQNNLNCKEIKIESKFIGENEDSYPGDNVHNFNSIHCDDASVKSFKWNVPVKRKQTFQETESFPYSKKSYSQILPMDNKISEHHFSTGETHKIAHTSQKTFPLTQTSNSQIYNKISGRGSSSQFN